MVLFLFGRPGAGKTTIGKKLASTWGKTYFDGDDAYTAQDQQAIRDGVISDKDSDVFLERVLERLAMSPRDDVVVTSQSLFRESQRKRIKEKLGTQVIFVYLQVSEEMSYRRLAERAASGGSPTANEEFSYGTEQFRREACAYEEPRRGAVEVWYDNRGTIAEAVSGIREALTRRLVFPAAEVPNEVSASERPAM